MGVTKAEKVKKAAAEAAYLEARRAHHERHQRAERLYRGRGHSNNQQLYDLIKLAADEEVPLPSDEEIGEELTLVSRNMRLHDVCRERFIKSGYACYRDEEGYSVGANRCELCAEPLWCAGEARAHKRKALTPQECQAQGIFHGGNCYHVSICTVCGDVSSVDSSG